jgi:hypothetical protein
LFQAVAIQHVDLTTAVANDPLLLQSAGGLGDTFAAHTENLGDEMLRHRQIAGGQTVEGRQQTTAQLLVQ